MVDTDTVKHIRARLDDDVVAVRAQAIEALGVLGDVRGLVAALASDDDYVRLRAVRALSAERGEILTWRIAHKRFDENADVRCAVAGALGARGGWVAVQALRRIIERDENAAVRHAALVAIAPLDSPRVSAVLQATMEIDPDPGVRAMAEALLRRRT